MIPQHSQQAREVLDIFFRGTYKLLVFFEDEENETLYESIVYRHVDSADVRVICLAGKQSLIQHRRTIEPKPGQATNFYVLDKDFDDLHNKFEVFDNFYYLEQYSIENYFWEENAAIELVLEEFPNLRRDAVKEKLEFKEFEQLVLETMHKLTALYYVCQKFNLGMENCAEKIERRTDQINKWQPCEKKIADYESEVFRLLAAKGILSKQHEFDIILRKDMAAINVPRDIPGKQLCSLLMHYLRFKFNVNSISMRSFTYRLAKNCSTANLAELGRHLAAAV